jgi:hypothetical protein
MHKLTLKIEEVIAFTKWLSDNQISAKRVKSRIWVYSHFWTLETIVSPAPKFMKIFTPADHDIRNNFSFGSGD